MRTVLSMALKDLRLVSCDLLGLFFILGFPILIGLFFGAMYGWVGSDDASLVVAVVDEDQSEISRRFVENLREIGNLELDQLTREQSIDRVRRGDLAGLIAVPKRFGETAGIPWLEGPPIELGLDPSRKAEAAMLEGMVMQAAGKLMAGRFQNPTEIRPFVQQATKEIADAGDLPGPLRPVLGQLMGSLHQFMEAWHRAQVTPGERDSQSDDERPALNFRLAHIETFDVTRQIPADSPEALAGKLQSPWDLSFPQAMAWGVLACAAQFAISIVRERKQGTFLRLQVAPVTRRQILAGKATACFLTVVAVILLLTVLGTWLGMRPQSPLKLAVAAVCTAYCFVGIMMLMSVIGKSEEAVSGAAWMANMFMAMFGGGMMPAMFMPGFMKQLSNFSPVKWSVLSLEGAIWRGFTWGELWVPCLVLLTVGSACLVVGSITLSRSID